MDYRFPIAIKLSLLTMAIVFTVFVIIRFQQDLAARRDRLNGTSSSIFKSKYGDVEYDLSGNGPVVLVSHGITGGVDQGRGLAREYLGSGYRFLYVSRFGYLKSSLPAGASAKLQADAYSELLDYLGIERAFIVGNSAGGTAAIHFAMDHPEKCRGLILISTNVPGNRAAMSPKPVMKVVFGSNFVYWGLARLFHRNMLGMFVPKPVMQSLTKQEYRQTVEDILLSGLPISSRSSGIIFDMFVSNPSIENNIPFERILSPTLIVHAEDDPAPPVAGARELASRITGSELVVFQSGGHLLLGHEDDTKRAIQDFVDQHPVKPGTTQ